MASTQVTCAGDGHFYRPSLGRLRRKVFVLVEVFPSGRFGRSPNIIHLGNLVLLRPSTLWGAVAR